MKTFWSLGLVVVLAGVFCCGNSFAQEVKQDPPKRRAGEVLYQLKDGASAAEKEKLAGVAAKYGLKVSRKMAGGAVHQANAGVQGQATEEAICAELMATGAVKFAEPDYLFEPIATPNDPSYGSQWHHAKISSAGAWDVVTGSATLVVAVLDTGVDSTHPDLAANMLVGYNSVDGSNVTSDVKGHGTATTGCVAAIGNNAAGVTGMIWDVNILPIRITNDPSGTAYMSNMVQGITYAADYGAKVANLSYGGCYSASVDSAAQYLRSKGGLLVMSAGNENTLQTTWPDYASFLIVGATDSADSKASFTNTGNMVDVVAPGVSILTTNNGGGYGYWSGTSFSSPITAGLAALIYAVNPQFTPAQVESFILNNCDDLGTAGEDVVFGRGRINAAKAVAAAKAAASNLRPTASIVADPLCGSAPLPVTFSSQGSMDPDGTIVSYAWDFGDGTTGSGATVQHTYSTPGDFVATLTVTDNMGATGQTNELITVVDASVFNPPTNLVAALSGRTVSLTWVDNANCEAGFYFERGTTAKGKTTWTRVATLAANVTQFSQTLSTGTFRYRVQAYRTGSMTAYSNEVQVVIKR